MLDYMAEKNSLMNHRQKQLVIEENKKMSPRVPLYPPLEDSDVLVMTSDTPSLTTSFADLLLEDRDLRTGREGRLSNDNRLYGDASAAATIASLRDTVMALQLQNTELSLCLQQERQRRQECQNIIEKDMNYIKKLEETVKTLKSTRLVIEPNMYRQIAETYIASRRTPVRRTCSSSNHKNGRYEDLVCDSDNSLPSSPTGSNNCVSMETSTASGNLCNTPPTYSNAQSPAPSERLFLCNSTRPRQERQWSSDSNESSASSDTFYQNLHLATESSAAHHTSDRSPSSL